MNGYCSSHFRHIDETVSDDTILNMKTIKKSVVAVVVVFGSVVTFAPAYGAGGAGGAGHAHAVVSPQVSQVLGRNNSTRTITKAALRAATENIPSRINSGLNRPHGELRPPSQGSHQGSQSPHGSTGTPVVKHAPTGDNGSGLRALDNGSGLRALDEAHATQAEMQAAHDRAVERAKKYGVAVK